MRRLTLTGLCIVGVTMAATPATAQEDDGELVVTARKRSEALQDVPVAVSAFSRRELETLRIDSLADVARRTPGFVVSDAFNRVNPSLSIRGMNPAGVVDIPTVPVFLDGIYVSGNSSTNFLLTDLERVEVAKGPQSALYGRNAFAGAVNYITRKPSMTLEGFVEATIGTRDRYEVKAGVSGPLVKDRLAVSIGVIHHDFDGFYRNIVPGGPPIGSQRTDALSAAVLWTPTAELEVVGRTYFYWDRDGNPPAFSIPANCSRNILGANRYYCGKLPQSDQLAANLGYFGFRRNANRSSLSITYDLGWATLTSLTGYNFESNELRNDGDYTPANIYRNGSRANRKDGSEELRLTSTGDGPFRWMIGGYVYSFRDNNRRLDQTIATQPLPGGAINRLRTLDLSLFGQVGYRLADGLEATAAVRIDRERTRFNTSSLSNAGLPIALRRVWKNTDPRFELSYKVRPDKLLYASIARGSRSGGFNAGASIFDSERVYDPDHNWTYEIGAKTEWLDRALTINVDGFWVDWSNQQVSNRSARVTNAATANIYVGNAASSRVRGVELQTLFRPVPPVQLSFNYAYVDARYRDYQDPDLIGLTGFPINGDVSGNRLPRQSPHQLSGSAEYRVPVDALGGGSVFARGEIFYQTSQFSNADNQSRTGTDTKVNLWAGLEGEHLSLTGWIRNLLDDRTPIVGIRYFNPLNFARAWNISMPDGRTYGATVRWRL